MSMFSFKIDDIGASGRTDAKRIKMSMFSFERDDTGTSTRTEFRGSVRGRGRGYRYWSTGRVQSYFQML